MRSLLLSLFLAPLWLGCPQPEPQWTAVNDSLDSVVLSVWGAPTGEVFFAGGGLGNGQGGLLAVRARDGAWRRFDLASNDTLWWVFGFSASDVWAVGEGGAIYHLDGERAARVQSPVATTLFGLWGASPQDLWAVGGTPSGNGPNDVLLHYDGSSWRQVPPPKALGVPYLKVWGSSAQDVFVVGQQGAILHYDGSSWTQMPSPVRAGLLTVAGRSGSDVWAVGGPPLAFLHYDGAAWEQQPAVGIVSGLGGVAFGANGDLFAVGLAGVKWRRPAGKGWVEDSNAPPQGDLHAVWVDGDGSAWAVGGNYLSASASATLPRRGIIAHYGTKRPAPLP